MAKPVLLDLFCKAGGCSVGYARAGFRVVGVDIEPQPRYPFTFIRADALEYVAKHGGKFDVIHASPPCQAYSVTRNMKRQNNHPDLVAPTRDLLVGSGKFYVIENVPGAPLFDPALICGLALSLGVKRHRLFESNVFIFGTKCPKGHKDNHVNVAGYAVGEQRRNGWVTVCGGGASKVSDGRRRADVSTARLAMGIDWMSRDELSQAIPPAYTEFIGRQLMRVITQ